MHSQLANYQCRPVNSKLWLNTSTIILYIMTQSHCLSIANLPVNDEQSMLGNNKVSWNSPFWVKTKFSVMLFLWQPLPRPRCFLSYLSLNEMNRELSPWFPFKCTFETGHLLGLLGTLASHGTLAKFLISYRHTYLTWNSGHKALWPNFS